jgi:eukaryotic translation initiation factor 2C
MREHKTNVHEDASRKKAEEANAWKRRMRIGPDTGKRQVKETGYSSEDSPIRRNESPERWPPNWTKEDKANAELLDSIVWSVFYGFLSRPFSRRVSLTWH